jgi:dUTP pyrophosphatase
MEITKVRIKIKKLNSEAIIPHYSHEGDAGMDVYSVENVLINPNERKLIQTGLSFEISRGFEIQIRPKSGLALNSGITILNTPGTLDSGYRGELKIILFNASNNPYQVKKSEKIAQIILTRYEEAEIEETNELTQTKRAEGGFGSTGLIKKQK